MKPHRLKRAVIKEELVAITGDYIKAIILNQLIYWTERTNDFDAYRKQEYELLLSGGIECTEPNYLHGWIYKTAEELADETMLGFAKSNMRSHLKALISMGFVMERKHPEYKWCRTLQYRVNLNLVMERLQQEGYSLEGYSLYRAETPKFHNRTSSSESEQEVANQNNKLRNETAISEITTENTSEITNRVNTPLTPLGEPEPKKQGWSFKSHSNTENLRHLESDANDPSIKYLREHDKELEYLYEWLEYKDQRKNKYVEKSLLLLCKKFKTMSEKYGYSKLQDVVNYSIENNYQGIVWDRIEKEQKTSVEYRQKKAMEEMQATKERLLKKYGENG